MELIRTEELIHLVGAILESSSYSDVSNNNYYMYLCMQRNKWGFIFWILTRHKNQLFVMMVLRCDELHANSLDLITNIESYIIWDIILYSDTNVLCSARLLERQLNDAMGILHKHKNQVVWDNLFLCNNKLVYRRHVSCLGKCIHVYFLASPAQKLAYWSTYVKLCRKLLVDIK